MDAAEMAGPPVGGSHESRKSPAGSWYEADRDGRDRVVPTGRRDAVAMGCSCVWLGEAAIAQFDAGCPVLDRHIGVPAAVRARAAGLSPWGARQTLGRPISIRGHE